MVARELLRLAAGRLNVTAADNELRLLEEAAQPNDQSTTLFAVIGVMVGILLALNAIMLTVPDRRRFVAEIRRQGFTSRQVIIALASQALILGIVSSLVGILLGYGLSHILFNEVPRILTFAFPISSHQVVHLTTVAAALGCGVLASLCAQLPPVLDLRSTVVDEVLRVPGEPGQSIAQRTTIQLGGTGALLVLIVAVIAIAVPHLTIIAGMLLALAVVCLVPAFLVTVMAAITPLSDRLRGSMLPIAVSEVQATATRSIALVGIAALAVYGSVAVQGARHDLIRGLDNAVVDYLDTAGIWVTTSNNTLNVDTFHAGNTEAAIRHLPGVAAVRVYQGGLLDIGPRRLWLRARSPKAPRMLEASQILSGQLARATSLLRKGGWAAISSGLASEHHLKVGDLIVLPTPSGAARFRIAAITTNIGWTPGAVTINTNDYQRYWRSRNPTALEVSLKPGTNAQSIKRLVQNVIHPEHPGLLVQTLGEREAVYETSVRQGLKSLGEISTLLLLAAALAIAATLSAAIWQRRAHLATMKAQGFTGKQIWRALLLEATILVGCGSVIGAMLGVLGHALASRWLELTTGFPAPFAFGGLQVLLVFALVAGVSLVVIALPGYSAAKVAPSRTYRW